MPQRQNLATVDEDLVDGQVEAFVTLLHLRSVERTTPTAQADAAALRAQKRLVLDALFEQEALDAGVGCCLERLRPPRRGAAVSAGLLLPALDGLGLPSLPPPLEHGQRDLEQ